MLLKTLEHIYGFFVALRNADFDAGTREIVRVTVPVISVGNVSAGGTGKTPFVQMLGRELLKNSISPAIVSRGYRRKSKGELVISDGQNIFTAVEKSGDELMMLAESLPVPVIANEDKSRAALKAFELFKIREAELREIYGEKADSRFLKQCIIVDDGFQHRKLHRNLDIVLIDKETLERPFLLPRGRLREPLESLKRADVIVLMNGAQENVLKKLIPANLLKENVVIAEAQTVAGELYNMYSRREFTSDSFINGAVAVTAIAKPERFLKTLEGRNYRVLQHLSFKDHHWFTASDVSGIIKKCKSLKVNTVVTTEKDAVKLRTFGGLFADSGVTVAVLPVRTEIKRGREEFLKKLLKIFE
jgi:tetraacyldisaccharide 4'-kinase